LIVAPVPASRPATAAPVSKNRFDFVIPNFLLNEFDCTLLQAIVLPEDR
jgi:hypothetical protein